ncbi:YitT family protein [Robertmurraya korlensis]|uniref:YitT family protein n=1 Tax=Robertmurraya korlensis TaxID=519977 RepID=UPI00203CDC78|nr:YitT family protein [Robertmurraya korlensis]MCM3601274.1 YitT family protein [Robertmurraya korlensis]
MTDLALEKRQHRRLSARRIIQRGVFITIGALLMAVGLEIFLIPNRVIDGGVTGVSIMLSHITGIKLGIFLFLLNLPFVYLGYKQFGKTFAISTIYGIIMLSLFATFFHPVDPFTDDILLATIFGGIFLGIGVGLVIRNGGALDGTEILSIVISKKVPFSVGEIVMFINLFILSSAGFVYTWDRAMYSILAYVIASKAIDVVITGMEESKSVWIISDFAHEIGDAINDRLGRGVTYLHGEGAYTGDNKKVIFCIITRLEESKMTSIVEEIDPSAFLAIADIAEVRGGRFKKKAIH